VGYEEEPIGTESDCGSEKGRAIQWGGWQSWVAIDGGKDIHRSKGRKWTVIQQIQEYFRLNSAIWIKRAVRVLAVFVEPYPVILLDVQMAFQRVS
jgi:hypothetical protein